MWIYVAIVSFNLSPSYVDTTFTCDRQRAIEIVETELRFKESEKAIGLYYPYDAKLDSIFYKPIKE